MHSCLSVSVCAFVYSTCPFLHCEVNNTVITIIPNLLNVCRVNLVYWLMCLLGISALLPYNVMLTEAEYFIVRTHQPPTITALADNFETVIVNCYTIA
jgi:hypothetical protein